MRRARFLLGKDLRILRRSPAVLAALVLYPLVIALIVGLVVRYAGDRPRVALVDEDGLPAELVVGGEHFNVQRIFDRAAEDVDLVELDAAEADRQLANGDVLGVLVIPGGFERKLKGMITAPSVTLLTTESALANRIVEKVQALVYAVNRELQSAFIEGDLRAIDALLNGGKGELFDIQFDIMGLEEAGRRLEELARSPDPEVAAEAAELADFIRQSQTAVENIEQPLRATANPIELVEERSGGRAILLSASVQAYGLALTLGFVALLLAAAGIASERDENVLGRLARGLVGLGELVVEKVAFVAIVAGSIGTLLALAFGLAVEIGDVAGGEPWARFPIIVAGLLLAAATFGALGVVIGAVAREARAATLVAFLVALPIMLLGLVPTSVIPSVGWVSAAFPFTHAAQLLSATLSDVDPAAAIAREAGWLVGLAAAYGVAARVSVRRLLT